MKSERRYGFTLVELLVVLAIFGLLMGLLLPAVQEVRGSAARASCLNNMKQIGLGLHGYHTAQGRFPTPVPKYSLHDPNFRFGWAVHLLPHIEQGDLWRISVDALTRERYCWKNPPHVGYATVIKLYVCPSDGRLTAPLTDQYEATAAYTSYIGVNGSGPMDGVLGIFGGGVRISQITDGTSQTLMAGERPPPGSLQAGRWYSPDLPVTPPIPPGPDDGMSIPSLFYPGDLCYGRLRFGPGRLDNPCDRYHFWSLHRGGGNWLFADGSAHFFGYHADPLLSALATRNGGEVAPLP